MSGEAFVIVCPWHDEHTTGDDAAYVWEADGERFPTFFCNHAHCSRRTLADLLACYPPEDVDACCTDSSSEPARIVELGEKAEQIIRGGSEPSKENDLQPDENDPEVARPIRTKSFDSIMKPAQNHHILPDY